MVSKHKHYVYSARSRTFLCGTDQNDYSDFALEWLVDELVEDGDEIVCLRVVDKDSKINSDAALQEGKYKIEARKLLEHIQDKNKDDEKSISVILEFAVGKVPETIQRMVKISFHVPPGRLLWAMLTFLLIDKHLFTCVPDSWYTRSIAWWYSRSTPWLRFQILLAELPCTRRGRSTQCQA